METKKRTQATDIAVIANKLIGKTFAYKGIGNMVYIVVVQALEPTKQDVLKRNAGKIKYYRWLKWVLQRRKPCNIVTTGVFIGSKTAFGYMKY